MKDYEIVLAGGGVAGLSLAYHLAHSPCRPASILIVDRDPKERNDRTLSFWSTESLLPGLPRVRQWDTVRVVSEGVDQRMALREYRYQTVRGLDFYHWAHEQLAAVPGVEVRRGSVERIEDGPAGAAVVVEGQRCTARWVFDSRPDGCPAGSMGLRQHFKGWEIEVEEDVFDPGAVTLFDLRVDQAGEFRFYYVLPYTPRRALVEFVLLSPDRCDEALKHYVETVLGIRRYRILAREGGITPLCGPSIPRRASPHVLRIGIAGGRVKPSSGYAFVRIQQDSAAITRSLLQAGHPFDLAASPAVFRLCDRLMLQVMRRQGEWIKPLMLALFRHNSPDRIFRFLDEQCSPADNLRLMASLLPQLAAQHVRLPWRARTWGPAIPPRSR